MLDVLFGLMYSKDIPNTKGGFKMKVINELPQEVAQKVEQIIEYLDVPNLEEAEYIEKRRYERRIWKLDMKFPELELELLGKGACGVVYALSEEHVIKIGVAESFHGYKDGEILERLQGLPFITKLYAYSEDGIITVMQRVNGITLADAEFHSPEELSKFAVPARILMEQFKTFMKGLDRLKVKCYDVHRNNIMVGKEGFFVVDVGAFKVYDGDKKGRDSIEDLEESIKDFTSLSENSLEPQQTTERNGEPWLL